MSKLSLAVAKNARLAAVTPPDLAAVANREHALVEAGKEDVVRHAILAGVALLEAKATLAHGDWERWLDGNFDGSIRSAQVYMRLAKTQSAALLDAPSIAKALAAVNETRGAADRAAKREANRALVAAMPEPTAPVEQYRTIVLDPPWDPSDEGDVDQMGRAQPTYATMPLAELLALPVPEWADPSGCHVYLWITNRSLPKGFALLEAWGFRYVTCLTWCKPSIGIGNYFRNSTEHVLFGVRGSLPLTEQDQGTWFAAPRGPGGHSSKPAELYEIVRRVSPPPRLAYFERGERPGFVVGGAEV